MWYHCFVTKSDFKEIVNYICKVKIYKVAKTGKQIMLCKDVQMDEIGHTVTTLNLHGTMIDYF